MTDALPGARADAAEPYRPRARLSLPWVRLINRLSRPRMPYAGRIEGLPLRLGIDRICLHGGETVPGGVEVGLAVEGGVRFGLRLPARILARIAGAIQPDLDALPPGPAGALLLELALAPLLDAAGAVLGRGVRVDGIGPAGEAPGTATLVLAATLDGEHVPVAIRLGHLGPLASAPAADGAAALLRLAEASPPRPVPVDRLPVTLAFVAGTVHLTHADLRGLLPGDAILPDVWHPEHGELAVTLAGRFATQAAAGRLAPQAATERFTKAAASRWRVRLKGALRRVADAPSETPGTAREGAGMAREGEPADEGGRDAAGLDALGVTLTFELARRTVEIGDLKGIGAGHVFDLALDPREPVDLRANGVRIGRGEIVEVGERLGVRVVRLFGGGQSS